MAGQNCASMRVLYPGTFDPPTLGHISLISRAKSIFGNIVVAVADSNSKHPLFSTKKRISLIEDIFKDDDCVKVISFSGLLVKLANKLAINIILRGLRGPSDFEYEYRMATTNALVDSSLETVFLMASSKYGFISSTLVKQVARGGGDISRFVPKEVVTAFKEAGNGND